MLSIIILLAIAGGLMSGYRVGAVRQIGSIVGLLAALLACNLFGNAATSVAEQMMGVTASSPIEEQQLASLAGHSVLFVIIWAAVGFLARMLHEMIKIVHLGVVNSLLGSLLMGIKMALVASVLLNLWVAVKPDQAREIADGPDVVQQTFRLGPTLMGAASEANF